MRRNWKISREESGKCEGENVIVKRQKKKKQVKRKRSIKGNGWRWKKDAETDMLTGYQKKMSKKIEKQDEKAWKLPCIKILYKEIEKRK